MLDVHAAARRRGHGSAYVLTIMTLVFVVVFGLWANYAVLDEVTRGEGRVIPSSKTQIIQNLEGGILAEILVREGDIVEKGDILVRIENTAAQATFRDAQSRFYALQATVERLEAELDDRQMVLSEEVLREAPAAAGDQTALFNARSRQLQAQTAVLETQVKQRMQETAEMRSRRKQLERSLQLAREELSITQPLVRNGVVARIDLVRQSNWQKVGGASPPERRSNRTTFLREPCVGSREGAGEASVAAWMGRAIEHRKSDGPGCRGFQIGRRQYRRRRFGEMSASPAVSENPCTFARLLLGPWEVFKLPRLS